MDRLPCVYMLTNVNDSVLYIGVTSDLPKRVMEHRMKIVPGFTTQYNLRKLVYFEATEDMLSAIEREKQLKRWSRIKKDRLIASQNPHWNDLGPKIGLGD